MDHNYNPAGLIVPTQIPLDGKNYFKSLEQIKDLGINNQLAFGYYACMPAFCLENKTWYVWDSEDKKNGTGLLQESFIYPEGSEIYGIDYSGESYNFYPFAGYMSGAIYTNSFSGFIDQVDDTQPVITEQSNTIGEGLTIFRDQVGEYYINHPLFNVENASKIFVIMPSISNITGKLCFIKTSVASDGTIRISTVDLDNNNVDGVLAQSAIKIEFFG